jgi:Zn-dependent protease
MGGGSIRLARIFGIRIGASPSWFVVLGLMIVWLSVSYSDRYGQSTGYALAVASTVLFFVSLTLHELGHALAARREGIGVAGIELWLFGGLAKLTGDSRTPGEELRIAGAGPLATALIVIVCSVAGIAAGGSESYFDAVSLTGDPAPAMALAGWLALVNTFLLAFNLVPAFPLDGGRIARALAWKLTGDRNRGTRWSARMGQVFAYGLIALGVFAAIRSDVFSGLWLAALGWFLGQAAGGAVASSRFSERLEGVTVADVMDAQPVWVPGDATIAQAQDEFFLRYRWPWFPVADPVSGEFLGLLRQHDIDQAVAEGRPALAVGEVLDAAADHVFRVRDDTPVEQLLGSEGLRSLGALMVVDAQECLRGVVTLDQVSRALSAATVAPLG